MKLPALVAAALLLAGCQTPVQPPSKPAEPQVKEEAPAPVDRSLARCDGKDGSLILSQDLSARIAADKDLAAAMLKACAGARP